MTSAVVTRNPQLSRYEIHLGPELVGFADYRDDNGVLTIVHTEVDAAHQGEGLGSMLIRTMLDDARHDKHHVLPLCPFSRDYVASHPDDIDLVPLSHRDAVNRSAEQR